VRLRLLAALAALIVLSVPSLADLSFSVPQYTVPGDNAWDYYVAAFALLPPKGGVWDRAQPLGEQPSIAGVEALLREGGPALAKLREGLGKPCVPLYAEVGSSATGAPAALAPARSMAKLLAWEGWLAAQRGDNDSAFASCLDSMALGQDVARNGGAMAKLVSIACEGTACSSIRRTVAVAAGNQAALGTFVSRLEDVEGSEVPYAESLAHEYGTQVAYLRWLRNSGAMTRDQFQQRFGTRAIGAATILARRELDRRYSEAVALAQRPTWEWSWTPPSQAEMDTTVLGLTRAVGLFPRAPQSAALSPRQQERYNRRLVRAKLEAMKVFLPEDQSLADLLSPRPGQDQVAVRHLADLRGTLLVAALELHRARAREYPAALTDLVASVLDSVPVDPWTGQPFRYERISATEYKLYSVGPDGADDGGVEKGPRNTDRYDLPFAAGK